MKAMRMVPLALLICSLSCTRDNEIPIPVFISPEPVIETYPTIIDTTDMFTFSYTASGSTDSYSESLRFTDNQVSYSCAVTSYRSGSCIITLVDTFGQVFWTDSIAGNSAFDGQDLGRYSPARIDIRMNRLTALITVVLARQHLGNGPEILGLWQWEYGSNPAWGPQYFSPATKGYNILYAFGRDNILSVFKNGTIVWKGIYSALPPPPSYDDGMLVCENVPYSPWDTPWEGLSRTQNIWFSHPDTMVLTPTDYTDASVYTYSRVSNLDRGKKIENLR